MIRPVAKPSTGRRFLYHWIVSVLEDAEVVPGDDQVLVAVAVQIADRQRLAASVAGVDDVLRPEGAAAEVLEPHGIVGEVGGRGDVEVPVAVEIEGRRVLEVGLRIEDGQQAERPGPVLVLVPAQRLAAEQVEVAVAVDVGELDRVEDVGGEQRAAGGERAETVQVLEPDHPSVTPRRDREVEIAVAVDVARIDPPGRVDRVVDRPFGTERQQTRNVLDDRRPAGRQIHPLDERTAQRVDRLDRSVEATRHVDRRDLEQLRVRREPELGAGAGLARGNHRVPLGVGDVEGDLAERCQRLESHRRFTRAGAADSEVGGVGGIGEVLVPEQFRPDRETPGDQVELAVEIEVGDRQTGAGSLVDRDHRPEVGLAVEVLEPDEDVGDAAGRDDVEVAVPVEVGRLDLLGVFEAGGQAPLRAEGADAVQVLVPGDHFVERRVEDVEIAVAVEISDLDVDRRDVGSDEDLLSPREAAEVGVPGDGVLAERRGHGVEVTVAVDVCSDDRDGALDRVVDDRERREIARAVDVLERADETVARRGDEQIGVAVTVEIRGRQRGAHEELRIGELLGGEVAGAVEVLEPDHVAGSERVGSHGDVRIAVAVEVGDGEAAGVDEVRDDRLQRELAVPEILVPGDTAAVRRARDDVEIAVAVDVGGRDLAREVELVADVARGAERNEVGCRGGG